MEIKLKPNSTKEKAKKYKVDLSDIQKKIEFIFKYMEEVGEEIDGTTTFEGVPLGLMVNKIRSDVHTGKRKYDSETIARLKKLGILEPKIIGIKNRMKRLERFCIENPALWRNRIKIHRDYLRYKSMKGNDNSVLLEEYICRSYETKGIKVTLNLKGGLEEKLEELETVLGDYVYISSRKARRKLNNEIADVLKEAGVGRPFGYTKEIEELSSKTAINPDLLDEIMVEYGSIENFRKIYIEFLVNASICTTENFESLEKYNKFMSIFKTLVKQGKIISTFDLSEPTFIGNQPLCYLNSLLEGQYVAGAILDKNTIQEALQTLQIAERNVLNKLCETHGKMSLEEVSTFFNLSRERTRQIREEAVSAMNTLQRKKIWKKHYDEEKRKKFIRKYFLDRDIFITKDSYIMNQNAREELLQILDVPMEINNKDESICIAELGLSNRAYNFLQENGYNTIQDLIKNIKGIGDFVRMKNSGVKSISEIIDKVHSLGFKFEFEDGYNQALSSNEKLSKEIRKLKATYKKLNEVLERYEELKNSISFSLNKIETQVKKNNENISKLQKRMSVSEIEEI